MAGQSKKKPPTVDELISALNKSSLPTVVIEGDDDVIAFRGLEDVYIDIELSVLPAGGRENVLELYRRRDEVGLAKIAFIADRDTWVMSDIPPELKSDELIFTNGYSIENDIYVDGNLERLLSRDERANFDSELEKFIAWYALALSRFLAGEAEDLKIHPQHYFETPGEQESRTRLREGEVYPEELYARLRELYRSHLRGKSLFGVLMRQLSYKGRGTNHNHRQIIEHVATAKGPLIGNLYSRVGIVFGRNSAPT